MYWWQHISSMHNNNTIRTHDNWNLIIKSNNNILALRSCGQLWTWTKKYANFVCMETTLRLSNWYFLLNKFVPGTIDLKNLWFSSILILVRAKIGHLLGQKCKLWIWKWLYFRLVNIHSQLYLYSCDAINAIDAINLYWWKYISNMHSNDINKTHDNWNLLIKSNDDIQA